jgi:hypothetical protein
MCNLAQLGLIKPFTEVTGYGENDGRHKIEDGAWVGISCMAFDVRESCEQHQKGGAS